VTLAGDALEEWLRVAPGLHLFGLLSQADVMPLAGYCTSFARWKTALETFNRVAANDPVMHGLLVKGSEGQPRSNPLVRIPSEAAADMLRFASEFGFTPAARRGACLLIPFASPCLARSRLWGRAFLHFSAPRQDPGRASGAFGWSGPGGGETAACGAPVARRSAQLKPRSDGVQTRRLKRKEAAKMMRPT
jgi:P27 family predicted phage terminase small subunit